MTVASRSIVDDLGFEYSSNAGTYLGLGNPVPRTSIQQLWDFPLGTAL
ncbi:hypothetical protein MetMK1DRAFT_00000150 [Metallosphaera yellowstonensis MK1]|uniref:Uncharacterized protein n=1 Tax=Metallosphaera yellowstonensis MK1 TaxID=671065 RepID=H2C0E4_9CREN|nr:hypothetical protein [Metallosphaera yellowstonensis]EHP71321.1 hypothetical protein MetMK1DRAFT_00000150 [Metallosphaera yellowstonensis MK1]